ncbi:UDP-glycosyltransferase 83A1-like isoform X1 [Arachis stenosperma]|uniref:UDP-glycosyltransferase 83A1-like isoform X1 n=1 Tax=Arachis stenosperma TaxID=217475 RepID=UPI0025ACF9BB|nr:UDP-glycosyltransferase 83A1-like isoform X1 [Arachis stenosperma]
MSNNPHFLVMPYPILGHMNPLLQFSYVLIKHGCRITFVISEFIEKRVKISSDDDVGSSKMINFVTLPDGLDPEDDRSDQPKVILSMRNTMPPKLHKLIQDINNGENKIRCILVSKNIGWALEVGNNLGIKGAFLWPASATSLASYYSIQSLIDQGIIDSQTGLPIRKQEFQLLPNSPMMDTANLPWCSLGKNFFHHMAEDTQTMKLLGSWWLCNTTCDLEPGALEISSRFLPIGPLMEATNDSNNNNNKSSSFWQEDTTCLEWLDQQQPQSVVYVSFGSLAVMESNQFKELALALDLINKPFLWVVRTGSNNDKNGNKSNNAYPDEFQGSKGKIVGWCPQKKVLNHPAIACFVSHCGWNSTVEGVCSGVPFLCWPHFSDQFVNKAYICDFWKVGLGVEKDDDENGLVLRGEIKKKVEELVGDEEIKARSLKLKEVTLNNLVEGGRSSKNLDKFINWAKDY